MTPPVVVLSDGSKKSDITRRVSEGMSSAGLQTRLKYVSRTSRGDDEWGKTLLWEENVDDTGNQEVASMCHILDRLKIGAGSCTLPRTGDCFSTFDSWGHDKERRFVTEKRSQTDEKRTRGNGNPRTNTKKTGQLSRRRPYWPGSLLST